MADIAAGGGGGAIADTAEGGGGGAIADVAEGGGGAAIAGTVEDGGGGATSPAESRGSRVSPLALRRVIAAIIGVGESATGGGVRAATEELAGGGAPLGTIGAIGAWFGWVDCPGARGAVGGATGGATGN